MIKHMFIVSLRRPYSGGLFTAIQNRIKYQQDHETIVYNLVFSETFVLRLLKKIKGIKKESVVSLDQIDGVRYVPLTIKKSLIDFFINPKKKYKKIAEQLILKHSKVETITCHWGMLVNLPIELKKIKPTIHYNQYFHGSDLLVGPKVNRNYKKVLIESLFYLDRGNCVSNGLAQTLSEEFGFEGEIRYTPNGVDTDVFTYHGEEKINKSVCFVGNLIDVKGAHLLPKVIQKISIKDPEFKFFIIGEGYLKEELLSQLVGYQNVVFTGRISVKEVAQRLKKTQILLMLSQSEGFPCVVNESKLSGNFIVGPLLEGILEANGKKNGLVYALNEEELVNEITRKLLSIDTKNINIIKQVEEAQAFDWKQLAIKEKLRGRN